jgi:alpha-beta hydrolase superfamily lysophospholipase
MNRIDKLTLLIVFALTCGVFSIQSGMTAESTMPAGYADIVKPELAAKYTYTEDGEFSKALNVPTYEWMPVGPEPSAIVVGVHGLTLHGRSYRVLARVFATNGIGFISTDMRGFGRCKFDDKKQFSSDKDNKAAINHEKSYQDLVKLIQLVKEKYSKQKVIVLGESLGCTFCVRLAGDQKTLVDGIVLSAPAVRVNPKMYAAPSSIEAGAEAALLSWKGDVDLHSFLNNLVSNRQEVRKELLDDPVLLKKVPLTALLSTDLFVEKTAHWGKTVDEHLPVLILQGSSDGCVAAKHVTDLMDSMPSDDQTLAWRGKYGHLQLETMYIRPTVIDALVNWLDDHGVENQRQLTEIENSINDLGGQLSK